MSRRNMNDTQIDVSGRVLWRAAGQDTRISRGALQGRCLALVGLPDGSRDILGIWIENTEVPSSR